MNDFRRSEQPVGSKAIADDELRESLTTLRYEVEVNGKMRKVFKVLPAPQVDAIMQLIQARDEHERTMGHRMEAYMAWDGYIRFCERNKCRVNLSYAYSLYRRYNELTDIAQEELKLTGKDSKKLAHYDMDFTDGSIISEPVGTDFKIAELKSKKKGS